MTTAASGSASNTILRFVINILFATCLLSGQAMAQAGKNWLLLINLDPLAIPIVVEGKIRGKITISLKLYLQDPEVKSSVRELLPKLKDTFLNYMYRYGASSSARGVLKLNTIMGQFRGMADKQFGKKNHSLRALG